MKRVDPELLLDHFYRLMLLTRRRHNIPPQPKRWFQNLIECFGGALKIRVAFKDSRAISAILTLRHKDTLVYKYGCSDAQFHRLGGVQFLFWKSISRGQDGWIARVRPRPVGMGSCRAHYIQRSLGRNAIGASVFSPFSFTVIQ